MAIDWAAISRDSETMMSFDPGETTGFCIYNKKTQEFKVAILTGQHHLALWEKLHKVRPDLVICEEFTSLHPMHNKGVELISRNYIGIIELYCQRYNIPLYMSSLTNKAFWNDIKLRAIGRYPSIPHERDALRHLLHFLTFKEKDQTWVLKLR